MSSASAYHMTTNHGHQLLTRLDYLRVFFQAGKTSLDTFKVFGPSLISAVISLFFFLVSLVLVVLSPLLFFVGLWLKWDINKLIPKVKDDISTLETLITGITDRLKMGESFEDLFNHHDYAIAKREQETHAKLQKWITLVEGFSPEEAPIFLRFIYKSFYNLLPLINQYQSKHDELLHLFDKKGEDGVLFKSISGEELWNRRNPAYEYLI